MVIVKQAEPFYGQGLEGMVGNTRKNGEPQESQQREKDTSAWLLL